MPRPLPPNPALAPGTADLDWSRFRRDWLDDGDDCISSSFHEALRLTYGNDALVPDVPEMEEAYRAYHPDWDDHASTMVLADYWRALNDIGVYVEALHQRGDIVAEIRAELDAGRFPTCWIYLWGAVEQQWFHHAVVAVEYQGNTLGFWDQQRGIGWSYDADRFRIPGDGGSSGYAYAATYRPVEQHREETPVNGADVSMYVHQLPSAVRPNYREKTVAELAQTLRDYRIDRVRVKVIDSGVLMGRYDPSPLSFRTLDDVRRRYEQFAAEGITMIPWTNPSGGTVDADVALGIDVGNVCGGLLDVDLEVGAGFWDYQHYGNGRMVEYFRRLKEGGLTLHMSTDPRPASAIAIPFADIAPYCDLIMTQSYWHDAGFNGDPVSTVRDNLNYYLSRGVPAEKLGCIFPRDGTAEELQAGWEVVRGLGAREIAIWTWDYAGPVPFAFLRDLPRRAPIADPRQQAWDALSEQYRVVHQILVPLIPDAARGEAEAALETYDRQLYPIKAAIGLT